MKPLFLVTAIFLSSCGACSLRLEPEAERGDFVFLSYNVHNLFDDADDGTEYPEYDPGRGVWNGEAYRKKLLAVGKAVLESAPGGPDAAAFIEIENDRVLEDLRSGPLREAGYAWRLTAPSDGAPVRVGLLSRLPVLEARCHAPAEAGYPQRPILEAALDAGGRRLSLFVCHFKSKSEGAERTEKSRVLAAAALRRRIAEILRAEPAAEILVLGDLNESADEYERTGGRYPTALMPADPAGASDPAGVGAPDADALYLSGRRGMEAPAPGGRLVLYSPWLDDPPHPGSYLYRGEWETIDHALLAPGLFDRKGLAFSSFSVARSSYLFTRDGEPNPDYSDHLPILVTLKGGEE